MINAIFVNRDRNINAKIAESISINNSYKLLATIYGRLNYEEPVCRFKFRHSFFRKINCRKLAFWPAVKPARNGLRIANPSKSGTYSYKPIEIKLYSVLRCIRDQFPGAFLRIANRGRRSRWFFTRGTSTPEGKPYAVEGGRAIMLITSTVPESDWSRQH